MVWRKKHHKRAQMALHPVWHTLNQIRNSIWNQVSTWSQAMITAYVHECSYNHQGVLKEGARIIWLNDNPCHPSSGCPATCPSNFSHHTMKKLQESWLPDYPINQSGTNNISVWWNHYDMYIANILEECLGPLTHSRAWQTIQWPHGHTGQGKSFARWPIEILVNPNHKAMQQQRETTSDSTGSDSWPYQYKGTSIFSWLFANSPNG